MNNKAQFVQAIRGPILLMALGTMFALDQASVLYFRQTWPLLIILFGVMKLIEKWLAPQVPAQPYPGVRPSHPVQQSNQPPAPFHAPGGPHMSGGSRPAPPSSGEHQS